MKLSHGNIGNLLFHPIILGAVSTAEVMRFKTELVVHFCDQC